MIDEFQYWWFGHCSLMTQRVRPCGSKWLRLAFKLLVCWWNSRTGFVELFHSLVLSMFEVKERPRYISKCQMQLLYLLIIRVSNVYIVSWNCYCLGFWTLSFNWHMTYASITYNISNTYLYIAYICIIMYLHMHTYIYIWHIWHICQFVFFLFFSPWGMVSWTTPVTTPWSLTWRSTASREGGRSQIAGCRWKRSECLQPVDLQWTERLYTYFGPTPPPSNGGKWRFRGIPYSKC